jgi:hypothetical protein
MMGHNKALDSTDEVSGGLYIQQSSMGEPSPLVLAPSGLYVCVANIDLGIGINGDA